VFNIHKTPISGCFEIDPVRSNDKRGGFVKVFHEKTFSSLKLETSYKEIYYSCSKRDVIRGMHFQSPPHEHVKIVHCVYGSIFDVVLDLRKESPSYGQAITFDLNAENGRSVYIPKGLAHGFCVTSESAILLYKVSSHYSPQNDMGIHWSSINVPWPTQRPIVSGRDSEFQSIQTFVSPF